MKKQLLIISFLSTLFCNAQTLSFQNLADMSYGRGATASTIVNDNIYVSNGYTSNGDSNIIEKYNITNNTWNVLNTTLAAKRFASSEMYNNKIYVFNGWGNNKVEIVDFAANTVTNGASNPFYTGNAGSAIYNGKIYTFGGSGLNGGSTFSYSSKFQYYDIASNTWTSLPDMPVAKETKGKIVNNKLYVIGGFNGTNSNLINVYDFTVNAWTNQYTMPVGVSGHSVAVSNNRIFIVGDYDNQTFLAYINTTTNQLHQLSSNMIARRHSSAEVYNNKLYIMGGSTTSATSSSIASTQVADISEGLLSANESTDHIFEIKAYPNPFRDHLVISSKKNDAFDYIIFSTEGRQISKGSSNFNKNIDLSNLEKGVYIFSFKNDKGILQQIKIIKN